MRSLFSLLIAIIVFCPSCLLQRAHRYIYASQAANINYFRKKGDSKVTAYYSGDGNKENDGFNFLAGYALSNHIALMAGWNNKTEHQQYGYDSIRYHQQFLNLVQIQTNIFDSSVIHYRRNTFEAAIGYFFPLDRNKNMTYNLYSGVSFGKFFINDAGLDSNNNIYTRYYNEKATRYFIQGYFNFLPLDFLNFSVGGKFSFLHFSSVNTSYSDVELSYFYLDKINHKTFFFWEPFLNIQLAPSKARWVKIDGQVSFTTKLAYNYPRIKTFNGSIGVTVEINQLLKKRPDSYISKGKGRG